MSKFVIEMSGPPACGKSTLIRVIREWAEAHGKTLYVDDGIDKYGNKEKADIHIHTTQTF